MPARTPMTGAPCWVDLMSSDPAAGGGVLRRALRLDRRAHGRGEYGGYVLLSKDGKMVGGLMRNDGSSGAPDAWSVYLASDDAQATTDKAAASGGQVLVPVMDVPDQGSMSVISDAGGAAVGVWQSAGNPGIQVVAEPGTPNWFELMARDYGTSVALLRGRVRLGNRRRGRHGRVPLHHAGRGRPAAGGHHGRERVPARGSARALGASTWGSRIRTPSSPGRRSSAPRWYSRPRTRPTGGWPR